MRRVSIISLVALAGCGGPLVRPPIVGRIALKPATPRVDVRVRGTVTVHGQASVATHGQGTVVAEAPAPPPPPPVLVPIENAPVPEFFGIPLDDAQDVVFVLDVSGSMEEIAAGRMAEIQTTTTPPPASAAPPPPPPPPDPTFAPGPPPSTYPAEPPPPPYPPAGEPTPPQDPALDGTASAAEPMTTTTATPAVPQRRKIEIAQAELVDALSRLPAGTRLNVLFFNHQLEAYGSGLFPLDEAQRPDLVSFVLETDAAGSTALAPAMRTAFVMNARRIVLLSDGLGNVGGGAREVLRDAREAIRGGVRIDAIGIGYGHDARLLESLARESGGLYQGL